MRGGQLNLRNFIKFFCIVLISQVLFFSKASAVPTFVDSYPVNSEEKQPRGFTFNKDGTKMFIAGYDLSLIHI